MKTATSGFISAISDGCPYHTVKFYYNGTELDITPKTFNYYGLMIGGENINIGETCASHIEFELYNPTITLENKEVQVKGGVEVNGSIEYVSLGYFTVTKPSIESEVYKYTAYDRMIGLERLYVSSLTNPTTVTVMNEIATQLGYTFASTITEISLDVNKIKGYTYREMLGFISALCGANCIFNGNGEIEFKWFVKPTSDLATIGTDRLYENGLELNSDEDITVGYIKCATGGKEEVPIEDNTTEEATEITDSEITEDEVIDEPTTETVDVILSVGSGSFGINISNPLMTQEVLENIYNTYFNNFTFRPCKVSLLGNILLECGDIVTVNNGTNTYTVPIMSIQHSIDGGVITNIETISQNETEQEISYTSPTVKLMDRVYSEIIEANKAIINDLTANTVTTEYLKANYAQINLANIENGCITNAMIGTEAVKTSQIADGSITDAKIVELKANKIKTGTLDVERLILNQNGEKYLMHINEENVVEYQKLDGNIIEEKTITADKIVAKAITAQQIATATITANEIAANTITSAEIKAGSIKAENIDVGDLFSKNITASGTISGLTLKGVTLDVEKGIDFISSENYGKIIAGHSMGAGSSYLDLVSYGSLGLIGNSVIIDSKYGAMIKADNYEYECSLRIDLDVVLKKIELEAPTIVIGGTLDATDQIGKFGTLYENGTALSSLYASKSHTHSGYASSSHTHNYFTNGSTVTGALYLGSNSYYVNNKGNGVFYVVTSRNGECKGSSRRFKENIKYRDNDYWHDRLMQVKTCTFDYTSEYMPEHDEDRYNHLGVIAEEVNEIFPELTVDNEDGVLSYVKYSEFVIPLISEVQRLNKEIDRLENLIKGVQA